MNVFLHDGLRLPVTNMFDVDGDETDNPEMATSLVAWLPDGKWLATECRPGEIVQGQVWS